MSERPGGQQTRVPQTALAFIACCAGVALFSAMDGFVKGVSLSIGVYNALLWRALIASIFGVIYLAIRRPPWPQPQVLRLHLLRGIIVAMMAVSFFWALLRLPLAEGIALSFISPLIALYLAAIWLKEKVERAAIIASLLGLAGVCVIIGGRTGQHYQPGAMLGVAAILFSALLYAINLIIQRKQAQLASPGEIAVAQQLIALCIFGLAAPWLARWPSVDMLPMITFSAVSALTSLVLIAWAYARAEAQTLIPVEYTAFLWSAITGWFMFGERLTVWTVAGAMLITAGCLIAARHSTRAEHIEPTAA